MRKHISILLIFIGIISACNPTVNKSNTDSISRVHSEPVSGAQIKKEQEYLKLRNDYIEYFKKNSSNNENWEKVYQQNIDSLLVLEKMLKDILNNSHFDSLVNFGKINLFTLQPDLGFGMLDGLVLDNRTLQIFVTSKLLFFDYFNSRNIKSLDTLTSLQLNEIFTSLLSDAHATVYYSENITSNKNVYAGIGITGQDIGHFPPYMIFVLVYKGEYIYIIQKKLDEPIHEIAKCQAIYDSVYSISRKYFEEYRESNLKDTLAIHKTFEFEETAWNKYCECYQNNFKNDNQYKGVQEQTEEILKYFEE
jgi:hypothetical protein